jgi:hypothetical protein
VTIVAGEEQQPHPESDHGGREEVAPPSKVMRMVRGKAKDPEDSQGAEKANAAEGEGCREEVLGLLRETADPDEDSENRSRGENAAECREREEVGANYNSHDLL